MGRLAGKVAVVTGAASQAEGVGNGAAVAMLFAREGAYVVLVNRNRDRRRPSKRRSARRAARRRRSRRT
jgi:NAD(P)-dependent dehydrogenase (short-subunit alcohol dehydrogenase family)